MAEISGAVLASSLVLLAVFVPVALMVKFCTWQPAQSVGFADGVPCVPMIVSAWFQFGGNQPARPKSVGPSGECAVLRVESATGAGFRWWHCTQRFPSIVGSLIE